MSAEYVQAPFQQIALGNREEFRTPGAVKAALAELISTFIFVFAGSGSGIAYSKLTQDAPNSPSGLIAAAIAHAFGLFVAVAVGANISGGHVNPAVTIGAFVGGNITLFRGVLYIIAQLIGSTLASLALKFTTGGLSPAPFVLSEGVSVWNAFVLEIILTFGLVYTVYATAIDSKKGDIGIIAPLAIGLIVGANILVGGAFDGASMNPAVSFGPALVSWSWHHHWVYWAGPIVGSVIAAAIYEIFFISHNSHEPIPANDY